LTKIPMFIKDAKIRAACCFSEPRTKSFHIRFDENNAGSLRLKQVLMEQAVYLIEAMGVTHFISGVDLHIKGLAPPAFCRSVTRTTYIKSLTL